MMKSHTSKRRKIEHEGRLNDDKPVEEEVDNASWIGRTFEIDVPDIDGNNIMEQQLMSPSVALEDDVLAGVLAFAKKNDQQKTTVPEQLNRVQQRFERSQQMLVEPTPDLVDTAGQELSHIPRPSSNETISPRRTQVIPPVASVPLAVHAPQHQQQILSPPNNPAQENIHRKTVKCKMKNRNYQATLHYDAPVSIWTNVDHFLKFWQFRTGDTCPICLGDFRTMPTVKITTCNHLFHHQCIQKAFNYCLRCPTCRMHVVEPRGKCPSGTMKVTHLKTRCGGFTDTDGSIKIQYIIARGKQMEYHENPGSNYSGSSLNAYLPNNDQGRELLKRLKYAWMHGLTLAPLNGGQKNGFALVFSIRHKTSPRGGPNGFPDPSFFNNCNAELDALGVPKSRDLAKVEENET